MSEINGYAKPGELFSAELFQRNFADVEVDGLGKFRMRTVNGAEAADFAACKISSDGEISRYGLVTTNARAVQTVCVDAEGNQIFTEDDIERINQWPAGVLATLAEACLKFSGLSGEDTGKN